MPGSWPKCGDRRYWETWAGDIADIANAGCASTTAANPIGDQGDGVADASDAALQRFRVEKMRFGKPTAEQKQAGLTKDRSTFVCNGEITLRGVPEGRTGTRSGAGRPSSGSWSAIR
jgi:hypothetical protein